jgi:nucleoside-diphosphate kinase
MSVPLPERTFIAIKPDGVERGLALQIAERFAQKGFKPVALKLMHVTKAQAETHYAEHSAKPFFAGLVAFITSGPVLAMVWEGKDVVATARKMMGATNPKDADPGTIRFDYSVDLGRNIIHGSDSVASAEREIAIFFKPEEVLPSWTRAVDGSIYE